MDIIAHDAGIACHAPSCHAPRVGREVAGAAWQARTGNLEVYHYELRGRQLALELTKSYLVLARRMFSKAAELDPVYARAYAGMVICDCYPRDRHGQHIPVAAILAIADKALDLDPAPTSRSRTVLIASGRE